MNAEIFRIKQELLKDVNFRNIKNIDLFAEKVHVAYWKKSNDIINEIRKASLWLVANPNRAKKNYGRFLTNWFSRSVKP